MPENKCPTDCVGHFQCQRCTTTFHISTRKRDIYQCPEDGCGRRYSETEIPGSKLIRMTVPADDYPEGFGS